jgi:hypothetical protein
MNKLQKLVVVAALFVLVGCSVAERTETLHPECSFETKLLPVVQMKWNDTLEFSVPRSAKVLRLQASADDVNTQDFGEVTFSIVDSTGNNVVEAKTEGIFKDWIVDKAFTASPGNYKLSMLVSNEVERFFRVAVDSC